jgi:hypothetical protein
MGHNANPVGIRELIERVKQELLAEHDVTQPLFVVGQVEVEVAFTVERAVNGGIDLQVVQFGGDQKVSDAHRVHVVLEPIAGGAAVKQQLTPEQKAKAEKAVTRGGRRARASPQMTK